MTLGGEHTMKGTDDVSQNFTLETNCDLVNHCHPNTFNVKIKLL